jgi:hypothetical protein
LDPTVDDEAKLLEIEQWLGSPLPGAYRQRLPRFGDGTIGDQVHLYPIDLIIERNEAYESKKYCPGNLAIGDDSGGRAVMIALDDATCQVFLVGHGSMDPSQFRPVSMRLAEWLEAACPID